MPFSLATLKILLCIWFLVLDCDVFRYEFLIFKIHISSGSYPLLVADIFWIFRKLLGLIYLNIASSHFLYLSFLPMLWSMSIYKSKICDY